MNSAEAPKDAIEEYLRQRRFARQCALQYLYQADQQQAWSCTPAELRRFWEQVQELDDCLVGTQLERARGFAERLITGLCGQREALDRMISACALNWTLRRMAVVDRNILRLAAYELFHCDDVPHVAAIDEAIELAKEFGDDNSGRFVNGILDRLLRERQAREAAPAEADKEP